MRIRYLVAAGAAAALAASMALSIGQWAGATAARPLSPAQGIHKIKHVIVIMQENRSFDQYFGTYPGAFGIQPGVCVPDPVNGGCVKPFVDHKDANIGGPHDDPASKADVNGGAMDGFVKEAELHCHGVPPCPTDVMGYHVQSDIPNYWAYAKHFALDDHLYESVHSWSLPFHMYMVSAWSANCKTHMPSSCVGTDMPGNRSTGNPVPFAWTDMTFLLHKFGVSWGYYLDHGSTGVPTIWNPLPGFNDVHADGQVGNVQPLGNFFAQAKSGTLPKVSWIVPDSADSEHPAALVSTGQAYVTKIINAVMASPDWSSSAIFVSWDDWGGFYDGVNPPTVDNAGYGIRVPGLVISPFARAGMIDHGSLSSDSYLRFIEDDFMAGARLDPATDGRPDPRPTVRENLAGNIAADFNFNQAPLPPLILNPCPPTTLVPTPKPGCGQHGSVRMTYWDGS